MNIKRKIYLLLVCLAVFITAMAQEGVQPGKVRIKLKRESVNRVAPAMRTSRSPIVYEGIGLSGLDRVLMQTKASTFKRMIPYSYRFDARHKASGIDLWYEVSIDSTLNVEEVAKELMKLEDVLLAQPIYLIKSTQQGSTLPFNDTYLNKQWNYNNTGIDPDRGFPSGKAGADIDLFRAWEITKGTPNVIVAIIDGGVDISHPDIKANLWINETEKNGSPNSDDDGNGYVDDIHGYDFVKGRLSIEPVDHGTHVAGIVAAVNGNNEGIAGVAGGSGNNDGVRLMSCQILAADGVNGNAAAAFIYAADNGAVIAQCSWSSGYARLKDQAILDAIDYFVKYAGKDDQGVNPRSNTPMNGGLVVFAAGNADTDDTFYPPNYEKCFVVGAIGVDQKKANYSNYGAWVDISAPGGSEVAGSQPYGRILSTLIRGNYGYMVGTSMACPHVSGIAALLLSHYGNESYKPEMLKQRMVATAKNIDQDNPNYVGKIGAGLVRVFDAFSEKIPDVERNLFFGTFPVNGVAPEQPFRILNSTDNEMELTDISLPNSQYHLSGFTPGTKLIKGEFIDLKIRFDPQNFGEYIDTLIVSYGADFEGVKTVTLMRANVLDAELVNEFIIFSDDFERGAYQWTSYDRDNDGKSWRNQSDYATRYFARSGIGYIMSESGGYSGGYVPYNPDNWLISPSVDLTEVKAGEKVTLSYWIRTTSPFYDGEKYKLLLSDNVKDDFNAEDFSYELLSETLTTPNYNDGYNYRTISLSDFVGKKVKIAFVHTDNPQKVWLMMDDFKVSYFPEQDYSELSVDKLGLENYEMTNGKSVPVTVQLSNNGVLSAENISVSYQLGKGNKITEVIDRIPAKTTINHQFSEKLNVTHELDIDTLYVEISPLDDELFVKNNKLNQDVWINKYPSAYFWDFEYKDGKVSWPKESKRITLDKYSSSPNLAYTQWGTSWATNREEFLIAQYPIAPHPSLGALSAVSNSYFTKSGQADRWLVFSIPAIETDELLLKWSALSFDPWKFEDYEVWTSKTAFDKLTGSTGGFDINDFTLLKSYSKASNKLSLNYLDFTSYANKDFCFAFRHTTNEGAVLLLDNIRLLAKGFVSEIQNNKTSSSLISISIKDRLVTLESPEKIIQIDVIDISGRIMLNVPHINSTKQELVMNKLSSGNYLLRVTLQTGVEVVKFHID